MRANLLAPEQLPGKGRGDDRGNYKPSKSDARFWDLAGCEPTLTWCRCRVGRVVDDQLRFLQTKAGALPYKFDCLDLIPRSYRVEYIGC